MAEPRGGDAARHPVAERVRRRRWRQGQHLGHQDEYERRIDDRPASTTSTTTLDSKILADLNGYYDAFTKAAAAANPDEPLLGQYLTGAELSAFRGTLTQLRASGRVVHSSGDHAPHVVSVQGTKAIVD